MPFLRSKYDSGKCEELMSMFSCYRSRTALILAAALMIVGCRDAGNRPPPGKAISIVIKLDGQPLTSGQVDLSGAGGGGTLNEAGVAEFKHVPFGEYKVVVVPVISMDSVIPTESGSGAAKPESKTQRFAAIPKQYQDEATTPLLIKVDADSDARYELELKKK